MVDEQRSEAEFASLAGTKVLVIDDSPTVRYSAKTLLQAQGCDVTLAVDGYAALAQLAQGRPAIIFTDVTMPRLNGEQFCSLLKHHPDYCMIPVVMLTARDTESDRDAGLRAGARGYVVKPFDRSTLLGMMVDQLGLSDRPVSTH